MNENQVERLNHITGCCEAICNFLEKEIANASFAFNQKEFIANLDHLRSVIIDKLEEQG